MEEAAIPLTSSLIGLVVFLVVCFAAAGIGGARSEGWPRRRLPGMIVRTEWSKDGDFGKASKVLDSIRDAVNEVLRRVGHST